MLYVNVCVCFCICVLVHVCVCVCDCVRACLHVCMRASVSLKMPSPFAPQVSQLRGSQQSHACRSLAKNRSCRFLFNLEEFVQSGGSPSTLPYRITNRRALLELGKGEFAPPPAGVAESKLPPAVLDIEELAKFGKEVEVRVLSVPSPCPLPFPPAVCPSFLPSLPLPPCPRMCFCVDVCMHAHHASAGTVFVCVCELTPRHCVCCAGVPLLPAA